jgi:hypothetical protein
MSPCTGGSGRRKGEPAAEPFSSRPESMAPVQLLVQACCLKVPFARDPGQMTTGLPF